MVAIEHMSEIDTDEVLKDRQPLFVRSLTRIDSIGLGTSRKPLSLLIVHENMRKDLKIVLILLSLSTHEASSIDWLIIRLHQALRSQ
jgi:hypothetical protein